MLRTLYPYQRTYLTDQSQLKHWVASRQIGKTHTIALEIALTAAMGRTGPLCGEYAVIISKDDESSKDVLRKVVRWLHVLSEYGVIGLEDEPIAGEARLTNGVRILSIPGGRPAASRGKTGSVWLDEFPFHRNQEENYDAAVGITTLGGLIRIVSTPFSDADLFWAIRENRDGLYGDWTRHRTTIHEALACGILKPNGLRLTIDELRKKMPIPERFAQEFECTPLTDYDSLFPRDVLDRATEAFRLDKGDRFGGYDIAKDGGDYSALAECVRELDRYEVRPIVWAKRGQAFHIQEDYVAGQFTAKGWKRMAVDETGMGAPIVEALQRRLGGPMAVEGFWFTQKSKGDLLQNMRLLMDREHEEHGGPCLSLPRDRDLWLDLHSIKQVFSDAGLVKYTAEHTDRGHSDRAIAAALAVWAASHTIQVMQNFGFVPVPTGGGSQEDWG